MEDLGSFYAMLAISGFLAATWWASRLSRLLGVSSIVLEIFTGVVLGPQGLSLMDREYAECEHQRHSECRIPVDFDQRLALHLPLGTALDRVRSKGLCEANTTNGRRMADGTGPVEQGALTVSSSAMEDGVAHRRLAGGYGGIPAEPQYRSYEECLSKRCEAEVRSTCSVKPDLFSLLGRAGVALVIFESGMHFNLARVKDVRCLAFAVALAGMLLPFVSAAALLVAFGKPLLPQGAFAGMVMGPTSAGFALRFLSDAGLLHERFGQVIITAAFMDDILTLVVFSVLFGMRGGGEELPMLAVRPALGVVFALLALAAGSCCWPRLLGNMVLPPTPRARNRHTRCLKRMRVTRDELLFYLMANVLTGYAVVTHFLGTHLWGALLAGATFASLQPDGYAHRLWVKQTKSISTWMVRIFFGCTVGFSIPVGELLTFNAFWKGSLMGLGPCMLAKVVCAVCMEARWVVGCAMVGRAEFAYLIAQMAASANMLDQETYAIVVWALLYATLLAPVLFRMQLRSYAVAHGLQHEVRSDSEAEDEGGADAQHGSCVSEERYRPHKNSKDPMVKDAMDFDDVCPLKDLEGIKLETADVECQVHCGVEPAGVAPEAHQGTGRSRKKHHRGRKQGGPFNNNLFPGSHPTSSGFLCCLFFRKVLVD